MGEITIRQPHVCRASFDPGHSEDGGMEYGLPHSWFANVVFRRDREQIIHGLHRLRGELQQHTASAWGLDDHFETFYTRADFEHFTSRFKERL